MSDPHVTAGSAALQLRGAIGALGNIVPDERPARVDESLRAFLRDNVDSFEALEVLLLLRGQPGLR